MKLNKILLTASILFGGLCASAQEEVTEYVFQPYWYGQAQFGAQETLGEGAFDILAGPNAQLAAGYQFSPIFGARISVNSWRSRATSKLTFKEESGLRDMRYKWHWTYIAPSIEATFNMTNLFGGYNPKRLVDVNVFAGVGINVAWKNNEANSVNKQMQGLFPEIELGKNENGDLIHEGLGQIVPNHDGYNMLGYVWDGTHTRFTGRFGFDVNFNITERLQIGLEANANVLNDHYNSKKAGNADWYFNTLIGVKYAFGPRYSTRTRVIEEPAPCEPQIIEKIVEKIVEVPVQVEEKKQEASVLRRDIFFKINKTVVTPQEMTKVQAVAEYLNAHPNAKVTITGYADKGTGTKAINLRLSAKRAEVVAEALRTKFNIPASRMIVKSMGDAEDQPYPDPVQNRVAICIAE
ncbi:MAG: OmpA family protein [Muribaculaceae bacterium]|nr:OmpA family protein [Muribaculaceae bacterium]MDE6532259.1 OmpA family protein [Muribaculaceae bacterium]